MFCLFVVVIAAVVEFGFQDPWYCFVEDTF